MRDIKLHYIDQEGFDIDIINGEPVYVDKANQTQDQRAAVAATIEKGTIPGALDIGVDWSSLYDKEASMLDIQSDIQKMVQDCAGGDGTAGHSYIPMYVPSADGSVQVTVLKGSLK